MFRKNQNGLAVLFCIACVTLCQSVSAATYYRSRYYKTYAPAKAATKDSGSIFPHPSRHGSATSTSSTTAREAFQREMYPARNIETKRQTSTTKFYQPIPTMKLVKPTPWPDIKKNTVTQKPNLMTQPLKVNEATLKTLTGNSTTTFKADDVNMTKGSLRYTASPDYKPNFKITSAQHNASKINPESRIFASPSLASSRSTAPITQYFTSAKQKHKNNQDDIKTTILFKRDNFEDSPNTPSTNKLFSFSQPTHDSNTQLPSIDNKGDKMESTPPQNTFVTKDNFKQSVTEASDIFPTFSDSVRGNGKTTQSKDGFRAETKDSTSKNTKSKTLKPTLNIEHTEISWYERRSSTGHRIVTSGSTDVTQDSKSERQSSSGLRVVTSGSTDVTQVSKSERQNSSGLRVVTSGSTDVTQDSKSERQSSSGLRVVTSGSTDVTQVSKSERQSSSGLRVVTSGSTDVTQVSKSERQNSSGLRVVTSGSTDVTQVSKSERQNSSGLVVISGSTDVTQVSKSLRNFSNERDVSTLSYKIPSRSEPHRVITAHSKDIMSSSSSTPEVNENKLNKWEIKTQKSLEGRTHSKSSATLNPLENVGNKFSRTGETFTSSQQSQVDTNVISRLTTATVRSEEVTTRERSTPTSATLKTTSTTTPLINTSTRLETEDFNNGKNNRDKSRLPDRKETQTTIGSNRHGGDTTTATTKTSGELSQHSAPPSFSTPLNTTTSKVNNKLASSTGQYKLASSTGHYKLANSTGQYKLTNSTGQYSRSTHTRLTIPFSWPGDTSVNKALEDDGSRSLNRTFGQTSISTSKSTTQAHTNATILPVISSTITAMNSSLSDKLIITTVRSVWHDKNFYELKLKEYFKALEKVYKNTSAVPEEKSTNVPLSQSSSDKFQVATDASTTTDDSNKEIKTQPFRKDELEGTWNNNNINDDKNLERDVSSSFKYKMSPGPNFKSNMEHYSGITSPETSSESKFYTSVESIATTNSVTSPDNLGTQLLQSTAKFNLKVTDTSEIPSNIPVTRAMLVDEKILPSVTNSVDKSIKVIPKNIKGESATLKVSNTPADLAKSTFSLPKVSETFTPIHTRKIFAIPTDSLRSRDPKKAPELSTLSFLEMKGNNMTTWTKPMASTPIRLVAETSTSTPENLLTPTSPNSPERKTTAAASSTIQSTTPSSKSKPITLENSEATASTSHSKFEPSSTVSKIVKKPTSLHNRAATVPTTSLKTKLSSATFSNCTTTATTTPETTWTFSNVFNKSLTLTTSSPLTHETSKTTSEIATKTSITSKTLETKPSISSLAPTTTRSTTTSAQTTEVITSTSAVPSEPSTAIFTLLTKLSQLNTTKILNITQVITTETTAIKTELSVTDQIKTDSSTKSEAFTTQLSPKTEAFTTQLSPKTEAFTTQLSPKTETFKTEKSTQSQAITQTSTNQVSLKIDSVTTESFKTSNTPFTNMQAITNEPFTTISEKTTAPSTANLPRIKSIYFQTLLETTEKSSFLPYTTNTIFITTPQPTSLPDSTESTSTSTSTSQPDSTESIITHHDTTESIITQPDTTESIITRPDTTGSIITSPLPTPQPDTTESIITQPDTTESIITQPDTTESIITSPLPTPQPDTTESIITQPDTTKSIITTSLSTPQEVLHIGSPCSPTRDRCSMFVNDTVCLEYKCTCTWYAYPVFNVTCKKYSTEDFTQVRILKVTNDSILLQLPTIMSPDHRNVLDTEIAWSSPSFSTSVWTRMSTYHLTSLVPGTVYTIKVQIVMKSHQDNSRTLQVDFPLLSAMTDPPEVGEMYGDTGQDGILTFRPPGGHFDGCAASVVELDWFNQSVGHTQWTNFNCTHLNIDRPKPGYNYIVSVCVNVSDGHLVTKSSSWRTFFVSLTGGVPGKVEDLTVTNITSTSALVTWSAPKVTNGYITSYDVILRSSHWQCYATLTNAVRETTRQSDQMKLHYPLCSVERESRGKNEGITLMNLTLATDYVISLVVHNNFNSSPAATIHLTTASERPLSPRDVTAGTTASSVIIRWTPPSRYPGPTDYVIVLTNSTSVIGYHVTGYNSSSVKIPNLKPGTCYTVQVRSNTTQGTSTNVTLHHVCTLESKSDKVTWLNVSSDPRSIHLAWTSPEHVNGRLQGYVIYLWAGAVCLEQVLLSPDMPIQLDDALKCNNKTRVSAISLADRTAKYTIHQLVSCKQYLVSIAAINGAGVGMTSNTTVTTPPQVPSILLKCRSEAPGAITFHWEQPQHSNCNISYHLSLYRGSNFYTSSSNTYTVTNSTETLHTSLTFENLDIYWPHKVILNASTSFGASSNVHSDICRSRSDVPGLVSNVIVSLPTSDQHVTVTWECPTELDRHGDIQEFHVSVSAESLQRHDLSDTLTRKPIHSTISAGRQPCQRQYSFSAKMFPQINYTLQIRAKVKDVDQLGKPETKSIYLPAQAPLALLNTDNLLKHWTSTDSTSNSSMSVNICLKTLMDNSHGEIVAFGVLVAICLDEACGADTAEQFNKWPTFYQDQLTWSQAKEKSFTQSYRATDESWEQFIRKSHTEKVSNVNFTVGDNASCDMSHKEVFCNGPISPGQHFRLEVFSCTLGGCTSVSLPRLFYSSPVHTESSSDSIVIGGAVGGMTLAAVVLIIVVIIRLRRKLNKFHILSHCKKRNSELSQVVALNDIDVCKDDGKSKPIKIREFESTWSKLTADENTLLNLEYQELDELSPIYSMDVGSDLDHRADNRWTNIIPFDHSRVKLKVIPEDPHAQHDYINANFISGADTSRDYIATQGPLTRTVADFWRMVWEQKVSVIVMLSDFEEMDKRTSMMREKVAKYYEDDGECNTAQHGHMLITRTGKLDAKDWEIRTLKLTHTTEKKSRFVKHFFFKYWSDHEADINPEDLIEFVRVVRSETSSEPPAPLVVHCSAGVGRTGTFIAVDYFNKLITRIKQRVEKGGSASELDNWTVDIFGRVLSMREKRRFMVQTRAQYAFIYNAVKVMLTQAFNPGEHTARSGQREPSGPAREDAVYDDTH
ncbi:mucin-17-like isoform X2 [Biomphalaria glabrata]|uniref:Mucin-17-like isoform X2 n=1 Tax=Biomphalaria glabrata TaxID=6526 RepID=A0A9U8EK89_BIOGL|nr:mucin-17-like isoform X2 [Biomphalaria glabrata]